MGDLKPADAKKFLAKPDIHRKWIQTYYREPVEERFYDRAFDYIVSLMGSPMGALVLDAGCGDCTHSIRLAGHGFSVQAIDFSEAPLAMAAQRVKSERLEDRISTKQEDLAAMSFGDGAFGHIVCWGVLMHIPQVEEAIAELARVLRPGGLLFVSESNSGSLESALLRAARRVRGKVNRRVEHTAAGIEIWRVSPAGALFTRQANIRWLIEKFESHGLSVRAHVSGHFTQLHTLTSFRPLRRVIQAFNAFWFRYVRWPRLSAGNIIVFEKTLAQP